MVPGGPTRKENKSTKQNDTKGKGKALEQEETPRTRRYTAREKGKAKVIDSDEVLEVMADSGQRDAKDVVGIHTVRKRAESLVFPHLLAAVSRNGDEAIGGIEFNPKWSYLTPLKIVSARRFRREAYCFLYYLLDTYKMAFSFNLNKLKKIIHKCMENDLFYRYLVKFLVMFKPLKGWLDEVNYRLLVHEKESGPFGLLVLGRKYMGFKERETTFDWINFGNEDLFYYLSYDEGKYLKFKNEMIDLNGLETMSELDLLLENPFYSTHNYPSTYDKQMDLAFAWKGSKTYYYDEDMVYYHPDSVMSTTVQTAMQVKKYDGNWYLYVTSNRYQMMEFGIHKHNVLCASSPSIFI